MIVAKFLFGRCCLAPHFSNLTSSSDKFRDRLLDLLRDTSLESAGSTSEVDAALPPPCCADIMASFRTMATMDTHDRSNSFLKWFAKDEFQSIMRTSSVK